MPFTAQWLFEAAQADNLIDRISSDYLEEMGKTVVEAYELDKTSRADWETLSENALKLAKQVREEKTFPFQGAANVKFPLITLAAVEFGSMAYPELVRSGEVVKCHVTGEDPTGEKQKRAGRIGTHMSWQLLHEIPEWEEDVDKGCHILPVVGNYFKKTYRKGSEGRNASDLLLPDDVVVNAKAKCLDTARRVTHRFDLYPNEYYAFVKEGLWKDADLGTPDGGDTNDPDRPHEFLEQHCFMALEKDGKHKLPLIVTAHKSTNQVVRVKARWDAQDGIKVNKRDEVVKVIPEQCFTHFGFIPNPDGGFYYLGFGQLLEPLNESINTIINQLLDAGRARNQGGGMLGRGIKIKAGQIQVKPGEWIPVDTVGTALKDNIFPFPWPEPNPVLLQLLGVLVGAAKEVASIKAVVNDEGSPELKTGAVMALMEKGLKVYTGIMKRIFRAFTDEFDKLYVLNSRWLDEVEYFQVTGRPEAMMVGRADYAQDKLDVTPVADPHLASDMQRMIKAQALLQASGRPGLNEVEVTRRWVRCIRPGEEDKLLIPDEILAQQKKPPDPLLLDAQSKMITAQAKAQESAIRLQMDMTKLQYELEEITTRISHLRADSVLKLAKADDTQRGDAMEVYKQEMSRLESETKLKLDMMKEIISANLSQSQPGGVGGPQKGPAVQGGPQGGPSPAPGVH